MTYTSENYKGRELEDFYPQFMNKEYSFIKGLGKGVATALIFGIPVLLQVLPNDWLNITVGGLGVILLNFLKFKYKSV